MIPPELQQEAEAALARVQLAQTHQQWKGIRYDLASIRLSPDFQAGLEEQYRATHDLESDEYFEGLEKRHARASMDLAIIHYAFTQHDAVAPEDLEIFRRWVFAFLVEPHAIDLAAEVVLDKKVDGVHKGLSWPAFLEITESPFALSILQSQLDTGLASPNLPAIHAIMRKGFDPRETQPRQWKSRQAHAECFEYILNHPRFDPHIPDSELETTAGAIFTNRAEFPERYEMWLAQGHTCAPHMMDQPDTVEPGQLPPHVRTQANDVKENYTQALEPWRAFKAAADARRAGTPDLDSPYDITNLTRETCLGFTPATGITPLVNPVLWRGHEDRQRELLREFHPSVYGECEAREYVILKQILDLKPQVSWRQRIEQSPPDRARA